MASDMDDHSKMKGEIRDVIKWALENMSSKQDREVSAYIKKQCDEKFGPRWQCIGGVDFKATFTCGIWGARAPPPPFFSSLPRR